uniref:Uncharacterized protein n=1 Tax=Acrobeloides nanus TaxID=290746 RepID=A0A914CD60_9BILA
MKSPSQSTFSHGCGRGTCRVPSQRPPSFTRDCANDPRTPLGQRRLKAEQKRYMYAMQQDANSSEDLIHQEEDDQAVAPVSFKEIPSAATVPVSEVLSPTAGKEVQTVEKEVQTVENLLRKENEVPEPKRPSPSILKNRIQSNDMPSKDVSTPRFNLYNNQRRFVNSQGRLSPPNKQPMSFPVADEEDYRHATRAHRDAPNSPFRRSTNFNHMHGARKSGKSLPSWAIYSLLH